MARLLQIHFRQNHYLFTFRIGFFLLCLFFFILFCLLGSWQLYRYSFKKNLITTYEARLNLSPVSFIQLRDDKLEINHSPILHLDKRNDVLTKQSLEEVQFQKVMVSGHYINHLLMLVQNKKYKDQMGFEVLTPLQISKEKKLLLIDRGWIPELKNHEPPRIYNVKDEQNISGYIKLLNEHQFILGKNILNSLQLPLVIQKVDIDEIERVTHESFYPFILRLDASQANGFTRDWTISVSLPQRHLGYAVQWFAMALVLLIAYFSFCIERVKR